jgi:hypothetical protein
MSKLVLALEFSLRILSSLVSLSSFFELGNTRSTAVPSKSLLPKPVWDVLMKARPLVSLLDGLF